MGFTEYTYSDKVRTRAEMIDKYGSVPMLSTVWTIHRAHASVTWVTDDGGEHWTRKHIDYAAERTA